jgi:hypothetical protein
MGESKGLVPIPLSLTELDATELTPLLEEAGIPVVNGGPTPLPNLPVSLLVPAERVAEAIHLIREARMAGTQAAEEAEAAGEAAGDKSPE